MTLSEKALKVSVKLSREKINQVYDYLKENHRIGFFDPNGPQEKLINLLEKGKLITILSAANGIGKTALAVNIIGNLIWGSQNKWFDAPLFKKWPYPKRIRYITDPKLVEEIGPFHSEIERWWPKGKYEPIKAGKNFFSQYKANGWVIDVMTYEQAVKEFEGGTFGLIITDEPPPKSIWGSCITRFRLGGLLLVLMTPLTSAGWFFDEVVPRHLDRIVYASMEDACKEHGIRGYLEHNQIQSMIAEMDPDEIEARAYGKAMYLRGLIYKSFDPTVHIVKGSIPVPYGAQMWHIVDPHIDKPFAMIWGFPDKTGVFHQVAEWPDEDFNRMHKCNLTVEDYRKIIALKEQGWSVEKRIIDRHFSEIRSLASNTNLREDLAKVGLDFEPSYTGEREIETGVMQVRTSLGYDTKKPITNLNRPKYLVSSHCQNTVKAFQRWSFDPKTGKVQEAYKDFMDVVRYALVADPQIWTPPPQPTYKKKFG